MQARERAVAALETYAAVRAEVADDDSPDQAYRNLTLSFGEHLARAQLEWAREALDALERISRGRG